MIQQSMLYPIHKAPKIQYFWIKEIWMTLIVGLVNNVTRLFEVN